MTLYTIGHSDRGKEEFLTLLRENDIDLLADVRGYPTSSHCPHFDKWEMKKWLGDAGIRYLHIPLLGGRRHEPGSGKNGGWKNKSFRSFADYALGEDFQGGLALLEGEAENHRVAYMCSEAVPWKCHRRIISDWLVARGREVIHIIGPHETMPHVLGAWGPKPRVEGGRVAYPAANVQPMLFEAAA